MVDEEVVAADCRGRCVRPAQDLFMLYVKQRYKMNRDV